MIEEILELKKRCSFGDEIGRAYQLSLGEVACITTVAHLGALTSKELASRLGISPSRASRVVGGLMQRGFIRGAADPADRRFLTLSLTDTGSVCYEEILQEKKRCEARLLSQLTDEQRAAVQDGLNILLQVI
jgi:DNA-binding MarR family transcriptional regulator